MQHKKTIFLHIGTHKTGTTALQLYFYKNRTYFQQKKILYPFLGCPDFARFGQHLLAWSCLEREDYLPVYKGNRLTRSELKSLNLWVQFKGLIAKNHSHKIVVSSEEFSVLGEEGVECVRRALAGHDVKIIVYLRRQDEFLEAAYGTSVIHSADTRNFYDFSRRQRTNLDYFELVAQWANLFGRENVFVRSYQDENIRKNLVKDFLEIAEIHFEDIPEPHAERVNASVSAHLIEVIRGLRLRGWTENKINNIRAVASSIQKSGIQNVGSTFMTKEFRRELADQYELPNSRLHDEFGCDLTKIDDGVEHYSVVHDFCDSFVGVISEIQDKGGFIEA